jgi:hypothetical protein
VTCIALGLLLFAQTAMAGQGGYNRPTNRLEKAFKIALFWRSQDPQGCYLSPSQLAKEVRKRGHIKVGIVRGDGAVPRSDKIFIIRGRTSCDHLRMATLSGPGLFVLDTDIGPVFLKGKRGGLSQETLSAGRGRLRAITYATKSFRTHLKPDFPDRFDMRCPGKTSPLGGGFASSPPLEPDGAGVYPHSYERLGVQRGWHISLVLFDPSLAAVSQRDVTLQAVCGKGLVPTVSPHKTVYMRTGQSKTAVARCPGGTKVFSGGFQRNNWISTGGSYVTESRAVGDNAWQVSGMSFARWGGELTAIAYCAKDPSLPLTEVSASAAVPAGGSATATTPNCPGGTTMIAGGFSENGSFNAFFGDGSLSRDGTFAATGYGYFGAVPSFTAYGYCAKA